VTEINTQIVVDAITLAIRTAYPDAGIYSEEMMQGVVPGSFNVRLVTTNQTNMAGLRYRRSPLFDVIYYSDNREAECVAVADTLSLSLEKITTLEGGFLHGSGITWRIQDFVLHFMVQYAHYVREETEKTPMKTLQQHIINP